ncbi:MAG: DUF4321 domain-containing protein [Candidatus Omnitrophota bacterium]
MKRGFWFFLGLLLISAVIGSAIGEIIGLLLPVDSFARQFFTVTASPFFGPAEFDLILSKITFGVTLRLNLMALLGMIVATVYYLHSL